MPFSTAIAPNRGQPKAQRAIQLDGGLRHAPRKLEKAKRRKFITEFAPGMTRRAFHLKCLSQSTRGQREWRGLALPQETGAHRRCDRAAEIRDSAAGVPRAAKAAPRLREGRDKRQNGSVDGKRKEAGQKDETSKTEKRRARISITIIQERRIRRNREASQDERIGW
jgi:hypothetical protein